MKLTKIAIGVLTIAVLALSVSTIALAYKKMDVVAETNDGTWVQTFTDNGNRCYVIERNHDWSLIYNSDTNAMALSISCVKQ